MADLEQYEGIVIRDCIFHSSEPTDRRIPMFLLTDMSGNKYILFGQNIQATEDLLESIIADEAYIGRVTEKYRETILTAWQESDNTDHNLIESDWTPIPNIGVSTVRKLLERMGMAIYQPPLEPISPYKRFIDIANEN